MFFEVCVEVIVPGKEDLQRVQYIPLDDLHMGGYSDCRRSLSLTIQRKVMREKRMVLVAGIC